MRPSAWLHLLMGEIAAQRGRVALLVICTALSCAICGIAFNLFAYLRSEVRPHIRTLFPEQRLVARPGDLDVAFLKLEIGRINENTVQKVAALDGVANVYPQMPVEFPVMADINISSLGIAFETEIVLFGVPAELIAGDLGPDANFTFDPNSRAPLPVAASAYFLDMYNMGLAESANLPKLSKSAAIGQEFDLILGESTIALSDVPSRRVRARIVGLVSNPDLMGVIVPIEATRAWQREYNPGKAPRFSMLHVDIEPTVDPESVKRDLGTLGLRVSQPSENLDKLRRAIGSLELLLLGGVGVVLLLAGVGIVSTVAMAARERRAAWGLNRATGMRPIQLLALVKLEAFVIALLSAGIAIGADAALFGLLRRVLWSRLDSLASIPGDPLAFAPGAMLAVLVLALALIVTPQTWFAWRACRAEPAALLQERNL